MLINFLKSLLIVCLIASSNAQATAQDNATELKQASKAALAAQIAGPKTIPLGDQAVLNLPASFSFIPKKESVALMHALGNQTGDGFYGLVIGDNMNGFVTVRFDRAGYIKDDDAKDWDADKLLQNLKDGTEEGNKDRRARGIPEFIVSGWIEKPRYDGETHRLVWSAELRDKKPSPENDDNAGANYNTYELGRQGYISMDMVTDLASVNAQKPIAQQLLAGLEFNPGKRYENFDASTDKVAKYGLAALVGGIVAKKLGILAMLGVFFLKFAKIIIVAVVAFGAGIKKFFSRNKTV
jgi:uncharacterized membrane-anchored protein